MAEERRKRRTKAEVAAAREQYLKEKEARQQARAEKQALREAKQQARAERQAAREKLIAERQARKEQREKLKAMTDGQKAQLKHEQRLEKVRKASKKETHPINRVKPYQGEIELGEWYTFRFTGSLKYGQCVEHKSPEDSYVDGQGRISYDIYLLKTREPKSGPDQTWIYPAKREDIIWKGPMKSEDLGYPNNVGFNGILYY